MLLQSGVHQLRRISRIEPGDRSSDIDLRIFQREIDHCYTSSFYLLRNLWSVGLGVLCGFNGFWNTHQTDFTVRKI
jgi:hypothetical protein